MNISQPKPIKYQFDADARRFSAEARKVERDLENVSRQAKTTDRNLDLDVDVDDGALTILRRRLIEARQQLARDIEVDVDLDATAALRKLNQLDRQIKQVDRQINVKADVDREHLQTSMDDATASAGDAASGGGSFLATLFAVGFGQGLSQAFTRNIRNGLSKSEDDLQGIVRAMSEELMMDEAFGDSNTKAFRRANREYEQHLDLLAKTSRARQRFEEDGLLSTVFDKDSRSAMRAAGGINRLTSAVVPLSVAGKGMLGAGGAAAGYVALAAALAAISAVPGLVGGGLAAGLSTSAVNLLEAYDAIDKGNRKARIVFGETLTQMQDWAEGLSANVGLGEKEIIAQSSAVQDLLVPRGFSRSDAAELTRSIYERGAALAEFSGLDTAQGVEAVNAALLGQRRTLKQMGVDITAKEVKERAALLKTQAEYRRYNEKQLETVATLSLIEEKSVDAWTAFENNTSAADATLDTLNSTIANLKTDAIEGFGGILADIISDFGGLNAETVDLAGWIDKNADKIRSFFLDLGILLADSAISALDLGSAIVRAVVDTAPAMANLVRVMGHLAANTQIATGALLMMSPLTRGMGKELISASGSTRDLADSFATAYENGVAAFGPALLSGIDAAKDGISGFKDRLKDLQTADALEVTLSATLKQDGKGSKAEVKAQLKDLTDTELAALIQVTEDGADKTEKKLNSLAKKERKARIKVEQEGAAAVKQAIIDAARDRDSYITVHYLKPKYGYGSNNPSIGNPPRFSTGQFSEGISRMFATMPSVGFGTSRMAASFAPTIINNYPKPERASDSLATSLRAARYAVGA